MTKLYEYTEAQAEAMSLHPKVKEILEKKVATMDTGRRRKSRKSKKSRRRVTRKH